MKKVIFIIMLINVFCLCVGCGIQNEAGEQEDENIITSDSENSNESTEPVSFRMKDSKQNMIIATKKELTEFTVEKDDEFTRINNNSINGSFFHPYKDGYFYAVDFLEKGTDGPNAVMCYDNGKGKLTKQKEMLGIVQVLDDTIYYLDENGHLKRKRNEEDIVLDSLDLDTGNWSTLFFTEDYIYFVEEDEESEKSYIYKVDYEGKERQKIYEFDINIDQIYIYKNKLWFAFYEFDDVDKNRLGVLDLVENTINVYKNIHIDNDTTGNSILAVNNGYIYLNSSGLKRLDVQNNLLEKVYKKNVGGVNFTEDCMLFFTEKNLFRINSDGVKNIRTLTGKTEGFGGIRVEKDKLYIYSYAGAFYDNISQIDIEGNIIKEIKGWQSAN
ncbi:MAG: hypothetical protein J1F02_00010 [Lachnospiraceae bacterium]|nr:hypothetical protein [Lachnospiraceae bacterium]